MGGMLKMFNIKWSRGERVKEELFNMINVG
jgi:hypothetical protein